METVNEFYEGRGFEDEYKQTLLVDSRYKNKLQDIPNRFFSLYWFRKNEFMAHRILNLEGNVRELLDRSKTIIRKSNPNEKGIFKFIFYKITPREKLFELVINNNTMEVLNVNSSEALYNPFIYAIAIKGGYLSLPRNWDTVYVPFRSQELTVRIQKHYASSAIVYNFVDVFNSMRIEFEKLSEIYEKNLRPIKARWRSIRNLKPFSQISKSKQIQIAAKIEKRRSKRSNQK